MIYRSNGKKVSPFLAIAFVLMVIVAVISFTFNQNKSVFAYNEIADQEEVEETLQNESTQQNLDTVGSIADGKGLGKGINVLTAQSNKEYAGVNALSKDKIYALPAEKNYIFGADFGFVSALNVSDFNINGAYNFGLGFDVDFTTINAGISGLTGGNISYAGYMYKYFYSYHNEYKSYTLSIENYKEPSTFQDCFSDIFLNDLTKLSNGGLTASAFFEKYGTHIIGSAVFGGRMTSTLSVFSNKAKINTGVQNKITSSISALDINTYSTNRIIKQINSELGFGYSSNDLIAIQNTKITGGKSIPGSGDALTSFAENEKEWCNSLNEDDKYNVIIDFTKDGLIPIWDLISDSVVAEKLNDEFIKLINENYNNYNKNYRTENKVDYGGGDGSNGNPYLIENVKHLKNISKNMSACYKMTNNISLRNYEWEPIGGFYGEKGFTGYFDGNGKSINYLTRAIDIKEKNNKIYFGLFSALKNNAIVCNLKFENVRVGLSGPTGTNTNSRAYVGLVAASIEDSYVYNCNLVSGNCNFDICTSGEVYVGGICGRAINSTISQCNNSCKLVSGRYSGIAGGIAGYGKKTEIRSCKNSASITTKATAWGGVSYAGGIVGLGYNKNNQTVKFYDCSSTVKGEAKNYGGGFICDQKSGTLIAHQSDWER